MVVGEAALAVSLADSLFLSIDPGAARSKVMLFLAISLAPFAVLAPIIGPYIDRLPGGRRITVCLVGLMRAMVLIAMMKWLNSLVLFPLAFLSLVLAKTYGVSRSAIMPTVVDGTEQLMAANGKLGRLTSVVGFLGGAPAVLLQLIDTRLSLGLSACAFAGAGIAALALPRHVAAVPNAIQDIEKHELHGHAPQIRQAAFVMLVLRAAVGFMFFHLAFWLRDQKAGTAWFGLAVAVCSLSTFAANAIGPLLRRRIHEQRMLKLCVASVCLGGLVAGYFGGITAGIILVGVVNGVGSIGRLAFESIVQSKAPDANRARAFVRYETRNQIAWVVAGLLAVIATPPGAVGFMIVGAGSALASLLFVLQLNARKPQARRI